MSRRVACTLSKALNQCSTKFSESFPRRNLGSIVRGCTEFGEEGYISDRNKKFLLLSLFFESDSKTFMFLGIQYSNTRMDGSMAWGCFFGKKSRKQISRFYGPCSPSLGTETKSVHRICNSVWKICRITFIGNINGLIVYHKYQLHSYNTK